MMMTNLFSIFDPSTPYFYSLNWMSLVTYITLIPVALWTLPSYPMKFFSHMKLLLLKELSISLKSKLYVLILPMILFLFILTNNLMGMTPYIFTSTSHLITPMVLSLLIWNGINWYLTSIVTSKFFSMMVPVGTPLTLAPFMVLIETISMNIRPLTLMIRLTANMIAGHLLLSLLMTSSLTLPALAFIIIPSQFMLTLLELAVAIIQAYVFTMLMTLYLAEIS